MNVIEVVMTFFEEGECAPSYVLRDGSIVRPKHAPNGQGIDVYWMPDSEYHAVIHTDKIQIFKNNISACVLTR